MGALPESRTWLQAPARGTPAPTSTYYGASQAFAWARGYFTGVARNAALPSLT